MRILIHSETGTRHIPDESDYKALCGYNGVSPDARDMWDVGKSTHLDESPEDFGDLPNDCERCAEVDD